MSDGPKGSSSQWRSWVEGVGWGWGGVGWWWAVGNAIVTTVLDARRRQAPACHQRPPTQQPNDTDASPSGSVISRLTAPLFDTLPPPIKLKGGGKTNAVWNTNRPRLSQALGTRREGRGMDRPGCRGPHGEQGERVAAGYRWEGGSVQTRM